MRWLRFLFFPVGWLYLLITFVRNYLYDNGLMNSFQASVPVIAVGNLSVGGTGKSPQTEYLIRLLSDRYRVAVLSRGYKRKSSGFVLANEQSTVEDLGDEPFQFYNKFDNIQVAVDANRTRGIQQLLTLENPPEIILLDDAFQHRKVKATAYVLLTAFGDLYTDDYILPMGNLRESRCGAKRARWIVVTKCPIDLPMDVRQKIVSKINPKSHQQVFFSTINYDDKVYNEHSSFALSSITTSDIFAVAGIANPSLFYQHLSMPKHLTFVDHHHFSPKDIDKIIQQSVGKTIITTEKDYMRLKDKLPANKLYYLPIKTQFLDNQSMFDEQILSCCEGKN